MNTSDNRAGTQNGNLDTGKPEQGFADLKEGVTDALGGARQQADAQFGEYRDTAADQIEALAKGAKSFVAEIEENDKFGMADYLNDMAESVSGLAGNLRGKSAEQLLQDAAGLARNNPALFIAGSIALGFGLSRFIKAGSSSATTFSTQSDQADSDRRNRDWENRDQDTSGWESRDRQTREWETSGQQNSGSMPPSGGFGADRPYESSVNRQTDPNPGLANGGTPASTSERDPFSDFPTSTTPGSPNNKGDL